MPKYKPSTARLKAKQLIKPYIKTGLNQSELARQEGVSQSAINQRLHKKPVRDMLEKYLDSNKLKRKLRQVAMEGLEATKVIGYIHQYKKDEDGKIEKAEPDEAVSNDFISDIPDHHVRHRFWHDIMQIKGHIKNNGNGKGSGTTVIIYGYRNPNHNCAIREESGRLGTLT